MNDDAKFIVTRISPIADLKEIKEYCGVCFDAASRMKKIQSFFAKDAMLPCT